MGMWTHPELAGVTHDGGTEKRPINFVPFFIFLPPLLPLGKEGDKIKGG